MSTIKKKKIKIKKKNFLIFILIILLCIFSITKISTIITKKMLTNKEPNIKKEEEKENKDEKENNKRKKLDYYNNDYKERYEKYKKNNEELSDEQIIKDVNMNLDLKHYEDRIEARNLNTEKILVNKYYFLTEDYVPENLEIISNQYALNGIKLVHEAKEAFEKMANDALKEELNIIAMSSYRSYDYQVKLYNNYVKKDGKEKADTYSGRPGHSEHQTGLAVDVYNKKEDYTNFEHTKEYEWMKNHAHEYGFILRFPKGKEKETGYEFESWHYRYVGPKAAQYIKEHNISFEEYYATIIKDW